LGASCLYPVEMTEDRRSTIELAASRYCR
jgi:hypothetical protein